MRFFIIRNFIAARFTSFGSGSFLKFSPLFVSDFKFAYDYKNGYLPG